MPTTLLPIQPGTLPFGLCFTGPDAEQQRLVAYAEALQAVLSGGLAFYNYGADVPDPENNSFPWLRTTDMRWYLYSGGWISPNPQTSNLAWLLWGGTTVQLATFDGGDNNAPSDRSGPMWEVVTALEGRVPVGVGTLQPSGTVLTVGDTGGVDEHTLTEAELPEAEVVPIDSSGNPIGNATVQKSGDTFGWSFQNGDFTSEDSGGRMSDVPLQLNGGGEPHTNMPPYYALYVIRRTSRLYYVAT